MKIWNPFAKLLTTEEETENQIAPEPFVKFSFNVTNENGENVTDDFDHDDMLLHCSFLVLCDFIDEKCGGVERAELLAQKMMSQVSDSSDPENPISLGETHAKSIRKMIELYNWYTSRIDWNDPIPEDPALTNLRNSLSLKIDDSAHSQDFVVVKTELVGTDEEKVTLGRLQAQHQVKVREFVGMCQSRMLDLIRIRPFMWI